MSSSENTAATPASPDQIESPLKEPVILATKVCGVVKWFSVKSGYGFISTPSSNEDVFVHSKRIKYNNPRKLLKTLAEGETVEFDIMQGEKGHEAINVTGPDGRYVQGSQFAANKPRFDRRSRDSKGKGSAKRKRRNRKNNRRGRKSSGSPSESKTEEDTKETKDTKDVETSNSKPNTENIAEEKKS